MTVFGFITSPMQWLLIIGIVVIIFGAKRLPEIGRALGKSIKDFKEEMTPEKIPGDKAKEVDARVIQSEKSENKD